MKEAIRVTREAHARYIGNKNASGWEEYAKARNEVKNMVEKKKRGMWVKEYFDGGMKEMWVEIKGIMNKRAGKSDKGIAALRAKNGKINS